MDQACEHSLTNEQLGTLLVLAYLVESHHPWLVFLIAFLVPLSKTLYAGVFHLTVPLTQLSLHSCLQGTHLCHCHLSQHLGQGREVLGDLPTASSPSCCLLLLSISPGEGVHSQRVHSW